MELLGTHFTQQLATMHRLIEAASSTHSISATLSVAATSHRTGMVIVSAQ